MGATRTHSLRWRNGCAKNSGGAPYALGTSSYPYFRPYSVVLGAKTNFAAKKKTCAASGERLPHTAEKKSVFS
jgi:hypothetical protein